MRSETQSEGRDMEHGPSGADRGGPVRHQHRAHQRRSTVPPSRRRVLVVVGVMLLGIASLTVSGVSSLASLHGTSTAGADPSCDGSNGCTQTMPCSASACPTVDVTPTTGLEDGEYVTVATTNFPTGGSARIALCSTTSASPAADPICLSGTWESNDYLPINLPIHGTADGTNPTEDALPVFYQPGGEGNTAIPGQPVNGGAATGFFCDNSSNPCAVEVTVGTGTGNNVQYPPTDVVTGSDTNTLVFPLTYESNGAGCPTSDPIVDTESSYSLEHFLPAAIDATCGNSNGVIALNLSNNNQQVESDLATGATQVAFIDAPSDPASEALLNKGSFAYIPIAVSGTSVGMLASANTGNASFQLSDYDLTPTMLAGLTAGDYLNPQGDPTPFQPYKILYADNLIPALKNATPSVPCTNLIACPSSSQEQEVANEAQFDAFDLLNPVSSGTLGPANLYTANSSVSSGASYQATDWMCNAPNTAYSVGVNEIAPTGGSNPVAVKVTDTNLAPKTLTAVSQSGPPAVFSSCTPTSTIPTVATIRNANPSENPSLQGKQIRSVAFGAGNSAPQDCGAVCNGAFGIMDSSEAGFYGLTTANLENANGDFVSPTPTSLEAAESNLSPCPALDKLTCPPGSYQVDYSTPVPGAYPLPDVTYAVIPTTAQPSDTAAAETALLTNLVNYSHSSTTLPVGYAPLSDSLYTAAMADISADVVAAPPTPTTTTTPTTTPAPTATTTPASTTVAGTSGDASTGASTDDDSSLFADGDEDGGTGSATLPLSSTSPSSSGTGNPASRSDQGGDVGSPSTVPTGFMLVSVDSASRYLLPVLVLLGLACLLGGPMLLLAPRFRRKRRSAGGQG
jgi:hypothetical protein